MAQRPQTIARLRQEALKLIRETRIAGKDTRHSRATNLHAIKELVNGHPHYTFGIKGVERFSGEEVLEAIADITKCSKDPHNTEGGGYISPESTLKGLELGAKVMYSAARKGGRFVVATGHPGSLLLFYIDLARLIRRWGGEIIVVERGAFVPPNFDLDYVEEVAVVSDRCSIWHSHDTVPMEIILKASGPVDVVVADHGFAGAAVNARIPVVGIVDTNDPALAVAKRMGADVVVVPMDDNRPLSSYVAAVDIVRGFAEMDSMAVAADGGDRATEGLRRLGDRRPTGIRPEVIRAEQLVRQRMGPQQPLDAMVEAFLEGFRDQFVQVHFDMDKEDGLINDPHVTLSIYGQVRAAVERFIDAEMHKIAPDLAREEVELYLGRPRNR
ncbi:MAG: phosphatase [Chloroflexi bacterium]|nr:phosphatase [Chloroflexota bacterium]